MSTEWDSVRRECSQLEAQLEVRAKWRVALAG